MPTSQLTSFVRQVHPGNTAIIESYCLRCGVLVAGGTEDKYLAMAEAAHKCWRISAPHVTQEDLKYLY